MSDQAPSDIEAALDYYHDEVVPALAAALTIDDQFPEEVLNEIRNALTHLARANKVDVASRERALEIDKCLVHFRRVCLDCLKICIFSLAQRSEEAISALSYDLQLPNDLYTQTSGLRRRRRDIAQHEGQIPSDDVVDDLKALLDDYDQFYQSLDQQFAGATAVERKTLRKRKEFRRTLRDIVIGIGISLLAGFLIAAIM